MNPSIFKAIWLSPALLMARSIVSIEGGDGSGKGTVIKSLQECLQERGVTTEVIGRDRDSAGELVGGITDLFKTCRPPERSPADFFLRIAREWERIDRAHASGADIVILDRGLLSIASRLSVFRVDIQNAFAVLTELFRHSKVDGTVFCHCPFEIAWGRVQERAVSGEKALSHKELLGTEVNKALFDAMAVEFSLGRLTGHQFRIDTGGTMQDTRNGVEKVVQLLISPRP